MLRAKRPQSGFLCRILQAISYRKKQTHPNILFNFRFHQAWSSATGHVSPREMSQRRAEAHHEGSVARPAHTTMMKIRGGNWNLCACVCGCRYETEATVLSTRCKCKVIGWRICPEKKKKKEKKRQFVVIILYFWLRCVSVNHIFQSSMVSIKTPQSGENSSSGELGSPEPCGWRKTAPRNEGVFGVAGKREHFSFWITFSVYHKDLLVWKIHGDNKSMARAAFTEWLNVSAPLCNCMLQQEDFGGTHANENHIQIVP